MNVIASVHHPHPEHRDALVASMNRFDAAIDFRNRLARMDQIVRLSHVAAASTLALVLAGCGYQPPSGPTMQQSINYSADDFACPGFPTFTIHSGWAIEQNNELRHGASGTVIRAWCGTQARYADVDADWTTDAMVAFMFAPALEKDPAPSQSSMEVDGYPAIALTYESTGSSWTQVALVAGDRFIQLEAQASSNLDPGLQEEILDVLTSAVFADS